MKKTVQNNGQTGQNNGQTGQNNGQTGQNNGQTGQNKWQTEPKKGQTGQNNGQTGQNYGQTELNKGQTGHNNGQTGQNNGQIGHNNGQTGWTEDSPLKFQQALLSPDNQQKISSFLINDSDCSSEDINKKAQDLCDIFLSAAKISLVTPKKNKKGSRPQKKWFDSDLFKMRKNVISLGKIYSRYPKDPVIKGRYYKYFRIYNKCRKVKYKQFINSMLQKLDTLRVENPKQYWKLINDIQDSKKENCSSQIDSDTWANHFRNLHSAIDNTFYSRLNQLEMILNDKEKYLVFNDLDNDISKKEISDAIASLKSGKACGPDLISNEIKMIRAFRRFTIARKIWSKDDAPESEETENNEPGSPKTPVLKNKWGTAVKSVLRRKSEVEKDPFLDKFTVTGRAFEKDEDDHFECSKLFTKK
ncbi:unnamed protein product [Mytilus edulis]|uniref:Uncharacterized protein n=1 Tax=Mytilus edulis TaxID=6550 RepID=A0A8S3SUL1_MYTED|nr:unnamed protein product [Mytilus edulis]